MTNLNRPQLEQRTQSHTKLSNRQPERHPRGQLRSALIVLGIAIGSLSTSLSMTAHADTYRWVDGNGIVNYSERKPRGVPDAKLTRLGSEPTRRAEASSATPNTTSQPRLQALSSTNGNRVALNQQQEALLTDLEFTEQERQAQVAKIRQENCDLSRRVLANLTGKDRIRVTGADGVQRQLPENERQERIGQAQVGIATNCDA